MPFLNKLLGRALPTPPGEKRELSVATGVPALGLDAISSTAYGPEALLAILLPLGVAGIHYFLPITFCIISLMLILYFSYQQTTAAYPNGGGAYIVASDNFGNSVGVWAAVALLADYLLNVAVGIAAGVGVIVSALPALQPYTLTICLIVLFSLTVINLRGSGESGRVFLIPLILFLACLGTTMVIAFYKLYISNGGHPIPVVAPPPIPHAIENVSMWLLLGAFANGLTAMTGIEAVSNAVPIFRKPSVKNAQRTLTIIVMILAIFLFCLAFLAPAYKIGAMDELKPGYQTVLSQLVGAVVGHGIFYYVSIASIFIILTYSAQTSFVGFPRVCKLLAEDGFMPHFFADRGRRLVYSHGIIILAIISGVLLYIFKGVTNLLIPLFAVGAFTAFLFSQAGMVMRWYKMGAKENWYKLFLNGLGAVSTAIALVIIIVEKFMEGAWIIVIFAPLTVFVFYRTRAHYKKIQRAIDKPIDLERDEYKRPISVIPIEALDRKAAKAIQIAHLMSGEIIAVHISTDKDEDERKLRKLWQEKVEACHSLKECTLRLEFIQSPYRRIYKPIIDFVKKIKKENPDHVIAVIIPELVEPHWYEYLLHNVHAEGLRALLLLEKDKYIVVVNTAWFLPVKK